MNFPLTNIFGSQMSVITVQMGLFLFSFEVPFLLFLMDISKVAKSI